MLPAGVPDWHSCVYKVNQSAEQSERCCQVWGRTELQTSTSVLQWLHLDLSKVTHLWDCSEQQARLKMSASSYISLYKHFFPLKFAPFIHITQTVTGDLQKVGIGIYPYISICRFRWACSWKILRVFILGYFTAHVSLGLRRMHQAYAHGLGTQGSPQQGGEKHFYSCCTAHQGLESSTACLVPRVGSYLWRQRHPDNSITVQHPF